MDFDPKYLTQKQLERVLNRCYDSSAHTLSLTTVNASPTTGLTIPQILGDCNNNGNTYSWQSILDRMFNEGVQGAQLDTDTALTANSDSNIASQKAVKTYVDTAISGENLWDRHTTPNYIYPHNSGDSIVPYASD
jgi:hypothetical protein